MHAEHPIKSYILGRPLARSFVDNLICDSGVSFCCVSGTTNLAPPATICWGHLQKYFGLICKYIWDHLGICLESCWNHSERKKGTKIRFRKDSKKKPELFTQNLIMTPNYFSRRRDAFSSETREKIAGVANKIIVQKIIMIDNNR